MPRRFACNLQVLRVFAATVGVLAAFVTPGIAQEPVPLATRWNEKVLLNFNGVDGQGPQAGPIFDAGGNLYGTSSAGGAYGYGTVFELSPVQGGGWTQTILYSFKYGTDGAYPGTGLTFDAAGNLYGTTGLGGTYNWGTVFELSPNSGGGWKYTLVYSFSNDPDAAGPGSSLVMGADGNLYGTGIGGIYCTQIEGGCGTVFELSLTEGGGWTDKVLHSFGNGSDGRFPSSGLGLIFDAAGNLYGTTSWGGTNFCDVLPYESCGTVFELSPTAGGSWTETVLYNFVQNGTDGYIPNSGLISDAAGNLYGTTEEGGSSDNGTVYELSPNGHGGWTEKILYSFDGADGSAPFEAGVIFDEAGNLYGTTNYGGTGGHGTVFKLTPTQGGGWTEAVLHNFCSQNNCTDGNGPYDGVIFDAVGNLYGTTYTGGTGACEPYPGCGIVFELTPVYPCATCSQSAFREADVLPAARGDLLGMSSN